MIRTRPPVKLHCHMTLVLHGLKIMPPPLVSMVALLPSLLTPTLSYGAMMDPIMSSTLMAAARLCHPQAFPEVLSLRLTKR